MDPQAIVEFVNQIGLLLLAIVVPLAIAGLKGLWPRIPPRLLPLVAAVLGSGGDLLMSAVNDWVGLHHPASPVLAAIMGLAGVGVRELIDQLRKAFEAYRGSGTVLCVAALACLLMSLTACAPLYPDLNADTARKKLAVAESDFTDAVGIFNRLRDADVIHDGSAIEARAQAAISAGNVALEQAHEAILAGITTDWLTAMQALNSALIQLQTITTTQERTSKNEPEGFGGFDYGHGHGRAGWADHATARAAYAGIGGPVQPGSGRGAGFDGRGTGVLPAAPPVGCRRGPVQIAA